MRTLLRTAAVALALMVLPAAARADDKQDAIDARLQAYTEPVALKGSSATSYLAMAVLAIVTVAVTFKNSKRSHLD